MDDSNFQRWCDELADLRKARMSALSTSIQKSPKSFGAKDLVKLGRDNVTLVVDTWLGYEQDTWQTTPPADAKTAFSVLQTEMESVIDLEIEAIRRDMDTLRSALPWKDKEYDKAFDRLASTTSDIKKSSHGRLKAIAMISKNKGGKKMGTNASGGSSSGGGAASFIMFIFGLLLGGAPAYYFWDVSKKNTATYEEQRAVMEGDMKALKDGMAVLQQNFNRLAAGEARPLPALDAEIKSVQDRFTEQKAAIEKQFAKKKEYVLRRMKPGAAQDAALARLEEENRGLMATLEGEKKAKLEKLEKERKLLSELIK